LSGMTLSSLSRWENRDFSRPDRLRAILNFTPGPQERTPPLGVNFAPRGEILPQGGMFSPLFTPGVNTLYVLEEWRGKQWISPPGGNFTPRGQNSPLGDNFAPGGQVCP
jgi:hypothetical protein